MHTWWLGRAAAAALLVCLLLLGRALLTEPSAPGRQALRRYVGGLDQQLQFLRSGVRGRHVMFVQIGLTAVCLVSGALAHNWLFLLSLPVVLVLPRVLVTRRVARRTARVEELIEPWLNAIANSLKASPSLREGIASSLPLLQWPMNEEIDVLLKENDLGTPLDQALDNMVERVRSNTLGGAVLALKIASKSGGNLPEMLESAAAGLREMARLEGVVRTKTAEGKAQTFVIGVLPLPMIAGVHQMDPRFFEPLLGTFAGHLIAGAAAVFWLLAILTARKILDVDI